MKRKIVVTMLACMALSTAAAQQKRIALDELRDKIAGAWLGQMVGNMYGLPFENKFIEKEGDESKFPFGYSKSLVKMEQYDGAFSDDDTDVEYLYLMLMEKYGSEPTYVSPDVFVYSVGDEFVILLNEDGLPHLQLSSMLRDGVPSCNEKEKDYVSEKVRSASWLIRSLYQRQRTLYKVVESIVKHQQPFFRDGVTKLAPLILKDIADDIGMHESTVSRITTNKYVATPHGIFELKFFFNSGLELDDGSQVGSESVKALIKKFIAGEDPKSPLSDERLGELLKDHLKVTIARRTVAKYRTALDIPSSSKRREHF